MSNQPPVMPGYSNQPPVWPPQQPEPPRKSRTVPVLVGALVVLALLIGGLVAAITTGTHLPGAKPVASAVSAAPATFAVAGTFELSAGQFITEGNACHGIGGYDDLAMGASVTITDAGGTVVGVGQVGSVTSDGGIAGVCDLGFSVPNVPAGKGFYGVEVSHRGVLKYSEAELKSGDAKLTI